MKKNDLEKFIASYNKSMKKAIKGKDMYGDPIEEQSNWVYYKKETLIKMLNEIDGDGGIKFYFGQYDSENIDILSESTKNREAYIGRVSIALVSCTEEPNGKLTELHSKINEESNKNFILNGGELCPPSCYDSPSFKSIIKINSNSDSVPA